METTESYDVLLIGSGMSALWLATELLRETPSLRIAIAEKYKHMGGRTTTFHTEVSGVGPVQWEGGAARISTDHHLLLALLKRYKLHFVPIGHEINYKDTYTSPLVKDAFEPAIPAMLQPLMDLPSSELANHTLRELLTKVHGSKKAEDYIIQFPYRGEMDILRADRGLYMFLNEFSRKAEYGICAEGFSALVDAMQKEIEGKGGVFLSHHEFVSVRQPKGQAAAIVKCLVGAPSEGLSREGKEIRAKHVVLAIPPADLQRIPQFKNWQLLRYLKMSPLLRFYGVFPKEEGRAWFEGPRLVTSTPIRYMIPASTEKGIVQLSYTDSQDTVQWSQQIEKEGQEATGKTMVQELEKLLGRKIPDPLFVKAHDWKEGVAYWLPGEYSVEEESRKALHPFPEEIPALHVCGDSYSLRQGWVEGALEHASHLLPRLKRSLKKKTP